MTLPIPFPIYGEIRDSNSNLISGVNIIISGASEITTKSESNGKYMYNIQNIVSEKDDLIIKSSYLGEHKIINWQVSLLPPSKRIDLNLEETLTPGLKSLNAYRFSGSYAYLFTSTDYLTNVKISDLDW